HVVLPRSGVPVDVDQREQLVHPGKDEELLGLDAGGATPIEDFDELTPYRAPVALQLGPGVDLLAVESVRDRSRVGAQLDAEGVGERMSGVGRDDENPGAGVGRAQRRSRGHRGLAYPAFPGDQQDAHLSPRLPVSSALATPW